MTRLTVLTLLAVLPVGGAAQRGDWPLPPRTTRPRATAAERDHGANAARLRPVWTFSTGVLGGHEGQPLVSTIRCTSSRRTRTSSTPSTSPGGYPLKWKYRPRSIPTLSASPAATRSTAAPSTRTGKSCTTCWMGTPSRSRRRRARSCGRPGLRTSPRARPRLSPLVVKHRVIVGASGGEFGIHGWLKGLDLETAGSSGPPTTSARTRGAGEAGDLQAVLRSWRRAGAHELARRRVEERGAPCGVWMSYDPDLDLLYYGPVIRRRYNPTSARATTNGPPACWPAGPRTARWCGRISSRHTTAGTTTPPRR